MKQLCYAHDKAEKEKEMLHFFADALLIAARMEPHRTPHHPDPNEDLRHRRAWLALAGLRR